MDSIVFVTNNRHKVEEISKLLENKFQLLSLSDISCYDQIPEESDTLEGNALQKAKYIYDKYHLNCFADDTGLEVEALNGRPGVFSARYSEKELPDIDNNLRSKANIEKLLLELRNETCRNATFRTVICLINNGGIHYFEGRIDGVIISQPLGNDGFGYDPVFIPNGYSKTFAEMNIFEKNKISHRAIATRKLATYLIQ